MSKRSSIQEVVSLPSGLSTMLHDYLEGPFGLCGSGVNRRILDVMMVYHDAHACIMRIHEM